jgi:hypothetical protein
MKITVFWDVAPCSLVETGDVSEVLTATTIIALMTVVAVSTFEISVYLDQTTRRNIPEDTHLHPQFRVRTDFHTNTKHQTKFDTVFMLGDRKYKVPALDPLEIEELKIADAGPRQAGLSLVMKNAKVYGMRNSMIEETK